MELSKQVCTRKQGERLEELGVTMKPIFCYCHVSTKIDDSEEFILPTEFKLEGLPDLATTWIAPAFTVAELGEILQHFVGYVTRNAVGKWVAKIEHPNVNAHEKNKGTGTTEYSTWHDTEASGRAAMLIYLLENNLTTPIQQ